MFLRKYGSFGLIGVLALLGIGVVWLLVRQPRAAERQLVAAQQAFEAGQFAQAAQSFAAAAQSNPEQPALWSQAGAAALQGGDYALAITYLERNPQLFPNDHFLLAQAYQQNGDLAQAMAHYQQSASIEAYRALWQLHRAQGDYPAAQADLQALLALAPLDIAANYQLGLLLASLDPSASLPYLDRAAQLDPVYTPALTALEDALRTSRFYDDPAYTYLASGRALAALNEWELAAEAFRRSIGQDQTYGEAWAYLGEALQQLGKDGSGELSRALLLTPTSIAVNMLTALYWQRQGNFDQAIAYLDAAAKIEPLNPVIQAEIGRVIAEKGDLPLAEAYYRRAIELAPTDPAYYRLLAEFALKHDIQLREIALPAARQALLLNEKDADSLDLMGQVLLRLGDPLTAERFLLQAVTIAPDSPAIHLHLGQVYWLRGESDLARQAWQHVQALSPDSTWAFEAQRWLER